MTLVDTSIWILHLRSGHSELEALLSQGKAMCHPMVIGELACGRLANRVEILSLLSALPQVIAVEHEEVLRFIENHQIMGTGIGIVDAHLLASSAITGVRLWTGDRSLGAVARELGLRYTAH
jgi:predicted nucleic acid-binding protein